MSFCVSAMPLRYAAGGHPYEPSIAREGPRLSGPLTGLRVIDLAGESGVFAGRMLAELGADVIRVEPPGGDGIRRRPPFLEGAPTVESLHHLHYNAGKRGITLDAHTTRGVEVLRRLAAVADIWLETEAPGVMDALGLGHAALSEVNPALVYASLTPFGSEGPMAQYRANDLVSVAMSGLMYLNGFPEDPPIAPGAEQAYHIAAAALVATTLVAVAGRARDAEGRGRHVEVSVQEAMSMATVQTANANFYTWHQRIPKRSGFGAPLAASASRNLFSAADGLWLSFVIPVGAGPGWEPFVDWLREEGIDSPVFDDAYRDAAYRASHGGDVAAAIEALVSRHPREWLFHEGQRRRILVMPVNDMKDLHEDPQLRSRGFWRALPHPALGRDIEVPAAPYQFSATPAALERCAPAVGEHNREVYCDLLGMAMAELDALVADAV
ncbi:MAG: CoA transferase, partial [Dehalococcoidia bacterium]